MSRSPASGRRAYVALMTVQAVGAFLLLFWARYPILMIVLSSLGDRFDAWTQHPYLTLSLAAGSAALLVIIVVLVIRRGPAGRIAVIVAIGVAVIGLIPAAWISHQRSHPEAQLAEAVRVFPAPPGLLTDRDWIGPLPDSHNPQPPGQGRPNTLDPDPPPMGVRVWTLPTTDTECALLGQQVTRWADAEKVKPFSDNLLHRCGWSGLRDGWPFTADLRAHGHGQSLTIVLVGLPGVLTP